MRKALVDGIQSRVPGSDFSFVLRQRGMFSYSGLTKEQVHRLRDEYSIYAIDSGRICVAALNSKNIDYVAEAVAKVLGPKVLIWKNDSGARELENLPSYVETAIGPDIEETVVEENGVRFFVPMGHGQKTGWFYDQAYNRRALLKYVKGARVLDVFSYLGAWGLAAAAAGASQVLCVDSSAPALELLQRSAAANGLHNVRTERADAFDALAALREAGERFDVVIIDPPAFIKRRKDIPKGQAAYRKLNQQAMQVLARDGFLVSCSCSHHLGLDDLMVTIQQAARHVDRFAQVVEVGGHAPDHPLHPAIAETRYLKSLFCRVVQD